MFTLKKTAIITTLMTALVTTSFGHLPSVYDASLQMGRTGMGNSRSRAGTVEYKNRGAWNPTTTYKGDYSITQGDTVSHGTFNGKKLWWWAKFFAQGADLTPGQFAPQGGTSPWVLINSLSAEATGTPAYVWHGYNGEMDGMSGVSAKVPTWRDGAEGAYSVTLDDIGAMPFDKSVKPAWELLKSFPDIKFNWGVFVKEMSTMEWDKATKMVLDGHEMFNHSMEHTSAADQWQWFYPGQIVPSHDPAIPEGLRGLKVIGTWGDPTRKPTYKAIDDHRVYQSPLVSIKATAYWTEKAPSSEIPGTVIEGAGNQNITVMEPEITPQPGVEIVTTPAGQKQYVKYDATADFGGTNKGYIAATGPTWMELSQLDKYGAAELLGGKGYWEPTGGEKPDWDKANQSQYKAGEIYKYTDGNYYEVLKDGPWEAPDQVSWDGKPTTQWKLTSYDPTITGGNYTGRTWSSSTEYVSADKGSPAFVAKVWCVKAWEPAEYKLNIQDASDAINKNIYSRVISSGESFRKDKRVEYFGYPFDAYSEVTHDSLEQAGMVGSRGGAKSGRPIPGDFFHPYRIDFDAFYITDPAWTPESIDPKYLYPNNPHVLMGMNGMVDSIVKYKGYMIRELHAVADIAGSDWYDAGNLERTEEWPINSAAKGMGGWWGGITVDFMKSHLEHVQSLIDAHKLTVYTVSELTKYRMTANEAIAGTVSINKSGSDYTLEVKPASDILDKYHDEISVIVSLAEAVDSLGAKYVVEDPKWGPTPRRRPKKMDTEGKKWSVSIQPYLGALTLTPDGAWEGPVDSLDPDAPVGIGDLPTQGVKGVFGFAGMQNGQVSLNLPTGNYTAQLFNVQGRMMSSVNISSLGGVMATGLKTNSLSRGVYFLQVQKAGAGVFQHKLMIR